jgi:BirA family biotin operon repressor/biotin-[acetyl-CoA-carboxylase] ligase
MTQPKLPPPLTLIALSSVGSTNDHAKQLAREGCAHGTVVWAREQTAGRGRQGNSWTSLSGNLFMTMVLRPPKDAAAAGQLSFVAGLALAETLRELSPAAAQVSVKWPNDVLVQGRKAAGILLESELDGKKGVNWIVLGIGVNLAAAPEGAICLKELGTGCGPEEALEKLCTRLAALYDAWLKTGFAPIRDAWLAQAHRLGETINVRLPREKLAGVFLGIDGAGALQLKLPDGSRRDISSGEVFTG